MRDPLGRPSGPSLPHLRSPGAHATVRNYPPRTFRPFRPVLPLQFHVTAPSSLLRQRPIHFALIKKPFFRLHRTGQQNTYLLSVRPVNAEDADASRRHAQIKKSGLDRKPWRVRQQLHRKRILKGFLNLLSRQRTFQSEGRVVPIKLHKSFRLYIAHTMYLHCVYASRR